MEQWCRPAQLTGVVALFVLGCFVPSEANMMQIPADIELGVEKIDASKPAVLEVEEKAPVNKWRGAYSNVGMEHVMVIQDANNWYRAWQMTSHEAPPVLFDPNKSTAVAIFVGQRNTGGYYAEIVGTKYVNNQLVVQWREHQPSPETFVTQALTTPYLIEVLPKFNGPVTFEKLP